jgi:hypothetical protein
MTLATRVRAMERLTAGDDDWCRCSPAITIRVWYPDDDDEQCAGPSFCTQCRRQKEMVTLKVVYDNPSEPPVWQQQELIDSEGARSV